MSTAMIESANLQHPLPLLQQPQSTIPYPTAENTGNGTMIPRALCLASFSLLTKPSISPSDK
jgi:hypothetical protein